MSDQLRSKIENARWQIADLANEFNGNESQTRQDLIFPILEALGWNTFPGTRIRNEQRAGSGKMDYLLLRDNVATVLVEAKPLDNKLGQKETRQLCLYCFERAIPIAILTNGAEWQVFRPGLNDLEFERRRIIQMSLVEEDATASTKTLERLHADKIDQLRKEDLQMLLNGFWDSFGEDKLLEPFSETLREELERWSEKSPSEFPAERVQTWLRKKMFASRSHSVPPSRATRKVESEKSAGLAVVLEGVQIPLEAFRYALVETAEWLIAQGRLEHVDCPVGLKESRYLVNIEHIHKIVSQFVAKIRLSNGL